MRIGLAIGAFALVVILGSPVGGEASVLLTEKDLNGGAAEVLNEFALEIAEPLEDDPKRDGLDPSLDALIEIGGQLRWIEQQLKSGPASGVDLSKVGSDQG